MYLADAVSDAGIMDIECRRGPRNGRGLTPGVQDGEQSDLSAEPFRISGDFEQGLGTGVEQQV